MKRPRLLLAAFLGILAAGLAFAPAAAADPVSDATNALRTSNLYVDPSANANVDKQKVENALDSSTKIAILPDGSGDPYSIAVKIGKTLSPDSPLTVGVVVGNHFDAASSKFSGGWASQQAGKAVDDNKSTLQSSGDLTGMLTDFAGLVKSGPLASNGKSDTKSSSGGGSSGWGIVGVIAGLVLVGGGGFVFYRRRKVKQELDLARAKVAPYYDRLAGEVNTLDPKDNATARQALADASERYTSAGSQLATADTVEKYAVARRTVLEGLHAARTARTALGIDPGPDIPPVDEARGEQLTAPQQVTVQGQQFQGYPSYTPGAPYYYGGGYGVPGGWYSSPFWETLLIGSVLTAGMGGFGWGGGGYGSGYDSGYDSGYQQGYDAGQDAGQGGDWGGGGDWGSGGGDWGGGGGDWGGGGGDSGGGSW